MVTSNITKNFYEMECILCSTKKIIQEAFILSKYLDNEIKMQIKLQSEPRICHLKIFMTLLLNAREFLSLPFQFNHKIHLLQETFTDKQFKCIKTI